MPNITTNEAITYTNRLQYKFQLDEKPQRGGQGVCLSLPLEKYPREQLGSAFMRQNYGEKRPSPISNATPIFGLVFLLSA